MRYTRNTLAMLVQRAADSKTMMPAQYLLWQGIGSGKSADAAAAAWLAHLRRALLVPVASLTAALTVLPPTCREAATVAGGQVHGMNLQAWRIACTT